MSDKRTIKGFVTAEEKRLFDERVADFGMYQQAVISRLALWWMSQPPEIQILVLRKP